MALRSLPLTDKAGPGGRPRDSRAPGNAFSEWLATCGLTPKEVADGLGLSDSSVYNMRNAYFKPGRELANKIAAFTKGKVSSASWDQVKGRPRAAAPKRGRKRKPRKQPAAEVTP